VWNHYNDLDEHFDEHFDYDSHNLNVDVDYDPHDLDVDEHNFDVDDVSMPIEWWLLHRRHSVLQQHLRQRHLRFVPIAWRGLPHRQWVL
jgi:hypothetical protein